MPVHVDHFESPMVVGSFVREMVARAGDAPEAGEHETCERPVLAPVVTP